MIENLSSALTVIGGATVVLGGLAVLAKLLVAFAMKRALESQKANLTLVLERVRAELAWHNTANAKRVDSACLLWRRVVEFGALVAGAGDITVRCQLVDKHEQMCAAALECGLFLGYDGHSELMKAIGPEFLRSLLDSVSDPLELERSVEVLRSQLVPKALSAIEKLVAPPTYAQGVSP